MGKLSFVLSHGLAAVNNDVNFFQNTNNKKMDWTKKWKKRGI
jgi:hypothetical protein